MQRSQCCDKHLIIQNTELFEFHGAACNFYCKIVKCVTRTQTPLIYPRFLWEYQTEHRGVEQKVLLWVHQASTERLLCS